jgi:hypothetical protein
MKRDRRRGIDEDGSTKMDRRRGIDEEGSTKRDRRRGSERIKAKTRQGSWRGRERNRILRLVR